MDGARNLVGHAGARSEFHNRGALGSVQNDLIQIGGEIVDVGRMRFQELFRGPGVNVQVEEAVFRTDPGKIRPLVAGNGADLQQEPVQPLSAPTFARSLAGRSRLCCPG